MHYLDSSARAKIYIDEPGSEWMRELRSRSYRVDGLICEIAGAEVFAAFHRRFRAGDISSANLQSACRLFRQDFEQLFVRLPVTKTVVDTGMQLIQTYPLRGYDSIQLATAVSVLNELQQLNGEFLYFVGAGRALNQTAKAKASPSPTPTNERKFSPRASFSPPSF